VKIAILAVVALLIIAAPAYLLLSSTGTDIQIAPVKFVGVETPVHVRLANPHGDRLVSAAIVQDGKSSTMINAEGPAHRVFVQRHTAPRDVTLNVGTKTTPSLHDGKAQLIVTTVSNDLRGQTYT